MRETQGWGNTAGEKQQKGSRDEEDTAGNIQDGGGNIGGYPGRGGLTEGSPRRLKAQRQWLMLSVCRNCSPLTCTRSRRVGVTPTTNSTPPFPPPKYHKYHPTTHTPTPGPQGQPNSQGSFPPAVLKVMDP